MARPVRTLDPAPPAINISLALVPVLAAAGCGVGAFVLAWFRPSASAQAAPSRVVEAEQLRWWHYGALGELVFVPLFLAGLTAVMILTGRCTTPVADLRRRLVHYCRLAAVLMAVMIGLVWRRVSERAVFPGPVDDLARRPQLGFWLLIASCGLLLVGASALARRHRPAVARVDVRPTPGVGGAVLFTGVADVRLPSARRTAATRGRLIDRGDHVEWHDGLKRRRWRLIDQPDADPSLPVLSAVTRAESSGSVVPGARGMWVQLAFTDPYGTKLALINPARSRVVTRDDVDLAYPAAAFTRLAARGVIVPPM